MNCAHAPAIEGRWLFEHREDGLLECRRVYRELRGRGSASCCGVGVLTITAVGPAGTQIGKGPASSMNPPTERAGLPSARRRQQGQCQETQGCRDDGSAENAELDGVQKLGLESKVGNEQSHGEADPGQQASGCQQTPR